MRPGSNAWSGTRAVDATLLVDLFEEGDHLVRRVETPTVRRYRYVIVGRWARVGEQLLDAPTTNSLV